MAVYFSLVLLLSLFPSLSFSASTTVTISFPTVKPEALEIVSPDRINEPKSKPIYTYIQNNTELDTVNQVKPSDSGGISTPFAAGIDSFFSVDQQAYNIPISYAFSDDLTAHLNIPFMTAKYAHGGTTSTVNGLGDVNLTIKYRIGDESVIELYTLATAKFPTGDAGKTMGSGAYEIALTEKVIQHVGEYRFTLMAGVSLPLNSATIHDSKVTYVPTISAMWGVERTWLLPGLWFGLRAAGQHTRNTSIDGVSMHNSFTTLSIIPETRFYTTNHTGIHCGVIIPAITNYSLPGGSKHRNMVINLGAFKAF
jgi:hypothetical protein